MFDIYGHKIRWTFKKHRSIFACWCNDSFLNVFPLRFIFRYSLWKITPHFTLSRSLWKSRLIFKHTDLLTRHSRCPLWAFGTSDSSFSLQSRRTRIPTGASVSLGRQQDKAQNQIYYWILGKQLFNGTNESKSNLNLNRFRSREHCWWNKQNKTEKAPGKHGDVVLMSSRANVGKFAPQVLSRKHSWCK